MKPFSHGLLYNFLNWFLELSPRWQLAIAIISLVAGVSMLMADSIAGIGLVLLGIGCFLAWSIRSGTDRNLRR